MYLKGIELSGFKSFAKKGELEFVSPIVAIVGPNGSGKSNVAEAFRFVLGEQSLKSMRTKKGEDLIWGGSNSIGRANRASVKAVFDNSSRLFDIDFDEVSVERVVHRDGVNQYLINGAQVRLKDIAELLASANIGSTGHHIISQGEADRLLSASIKERREMIEDALGLKIFQYKKKESERKLSQTEENISQVSSLRKEIAPHIRFLKRQVEKIEKSKQMREELSELLKEYLKRESVYLLHTKKEIISKRSAPQAALGTLEADLADARSVLEKNSGEDARSKDILDAERLLREVRTERDALSRDIGRLEGQITFAQKHVTIVSGETVPLTDVRGLTADIEHVLTETSVLVDALNKVRSLFGSFFEKHAAKKEEDVTSLTELEESKKKLEVRFSELEAREKDYAQQYKTLQDELEATKDEGRDAERDVFKITAEKNKIDGILRDLARDEEVLQQLEAEFKRDMEEGAVLGGRSVLQYESVALSEASILEEVRSAQEERKRTIERIKIRVEELGGGSSEEILKEYTEAYERDQFLEKEIADLEQSAETLKGLIINLDEKLALRFKEGITKINKEFQHFFEVLFDGGTAILTVIEQKKKKKADDVLMSEEDIEREIESEEDVEAGIDIGIILPRKKVKGLQMLSGGERALTSIALLFAMSQVNPPPFLVLDETEAALDEANSRKYSAMVKDLSQKTQLILITHNRETMSVAGVLYGVTMGSDGISKLLSVKLEEAVQVAK
ncbi:MAG: AAA family ATPase [Candidatus Paceibacterota bacterium]